MEKRWNYDDKYSGCRFYSGTDESFRNDTNKVAQADFGQFLQNALDGVNSRIVESDNLKERFELGDESISLSDVMISSQKASLAFEATVQIRNKCIDAYKTIMQMQV